MDPMPLLTYQAIQHEIKNFKGSYRDNEIALRLKFPNIPVSTLGSIISLYVQRLMKAKYRKNPEIAANYHESLQECINFNPSKNINSLAQEKGISSGLYARTLLGHVYNDQTVLKRNVKDTTHIEDRNLAYQTYLAVISDNQYGPFADIVKQAIGAEYEIRLERELKLMKITYSDENDLRTRGYDKTPDFKLEVPIAVDGFIIHWIESKALFGDEENHQGYLKDQLTCYCNRFGPGLVIYWFGFLETIEETPEVNKMFILRSFFPSKESITTYKFDE